jgi:type IV pilus secretin PilQ/predicted competence protein
MKKAVIVVFLMLALVASGCATSGNLSRNQKEELATAPETVITDIVIRDNIVDIKAGGPFAYTVYKSDDPYRVIAEIPFVQIGKHEERIRSRSAGITEVVTTRVETPRPALRIEILLQAPVEMDPSYHDNTLTLKVRDAEKAIPHFSGDEHIRFQDLVETGLVRNAAYEVSEADTSLAGVGSSEKPDTKPEASLETVKAPDLPQATEISDVFFDKADGAVELFIKGNGSMNPVVFTLKNKIVIDVPNVKMKAKIPSNVMTPVKGIRVGKHMDKVRFVLDLKDMGEFDVSPVKDAIVVTIKTPEMVPGEAVAESVPPPLKGAAVKKVEPAAQEEIAKGAPGEAETKEPAIAVKESGYRGARISLDFQDADIVPIFRLLADISGYNIVVSPEVKGKITMKLLNVPWDQALDLIMRTFALGKSVEGNIIRIAPLSVFAKENDEKAKERESKVKAEPLETKTFPISYAKVSVVEKAIKDSKVLSPRGSISVDERTSSLVVKDVPSVFPQVEDLLATLDKPTPEVMIEARIVEVSTQNTRDLGIQWGLKLNAANTLSSLGGYNVLNTGAFTGNNFMVDFPSTSAAQGAGSGFTFGILNPNRTFGLDLALSALEKINKGRIISNPRVVTTDNEKAVIMQGTSEPFPKLTSEGTVSVDYKDVMLKTEVKPHITPTGSVGLEVSVTKEDVLNTVNIGGSQVPRTSKIEANSKVLVENGETLVIGGVYKKTENVTDTGVPGLMRVPVLGWLFKNNNINDQTNELLIFITPRILEKPGEGMRASR